VIHSGVYYRPGSLKARLVAAGRKALLEFCESNGVSYRITGKVIVAVDERERPRLEELRRRGEQNGVRTELVGAGRLAELEPHAAGVAALHVPGAGIVDFAQVCESLCRRLGERDGEVRTGWRVLGLEERAGGAVVRTDRAEMGARVVVNCAGLQSDRLAAGTAAAEGPPVRIVPFRGEYRRMVHDRSHLVRSMIYPVPDSRFPFLGVHFTRAIDGEVHAGPNAVLALAREGYSWRAVDPVDTWDLLRFAGFRRLAARHWRPGLAEVRRSLSRRAFVAELQRLVPALRAGDLRAAGAGVRAQAVAADGSLVDDFVIRQSPSMVHVLNAPSPAATASLEIGRMVAARAVGGLRP
jgi:L-2-hydroxyglutarate oxidase